MTETGTPFTHSTPELYDRYMGPLLFEPYAQVVAERAALLQPDRILETAAGTGIVTRALHKAAPQAQIVATDVNPAMLAVAAQKLRSDSVSFQQADAQTLPFDHESFDFVVCQFGAMFYPDKVRAHQEARRVLRSNGHYLLVSFTGLTATPFHMQRGPRSQRCFPTIPEYMERGLVLGSPFRAEIERRDSSAVDRALDAVTAALAPWDENDAPMSAHVVTATK
jgi:ubiquinone/menaquinone biosynthesis C-methylase UbiE